MYVDHMHACMHAMRETLTYKAVHLVQTHAIDTHSTAITCIDYINGNVVFWCIHFFVKIVEKLLEDKKYKKKCSYICFPSSMDQKRHTLSLAFRVLKIT